MKKIIISLYIALLSQSYAETNSVDSENVSGGGGIRKL